jgi:hypothetical protein
MLKLAFYADFRLRSVDVMLLRDGFYLVFVCSVTQLCIDESARITEEFGTYVRNNVLT